MAQIERSALVPFSAEDMYNLVNDVAQYSTFLPGCADSRVEERTESFMQAALLVKKAGISQWFTTRNVLTQNQKIDMTLVDGPFKTLHGGWEFTSLDAQACKIALNLEFEFESRIIEAAFGKVFKSLTSSMVNAFTQRAREVYA